ncbi:GAF domain-containing protein [Sorangium sp. So ce118]
MWSVCTPPSARPTPEDCAAAGAIVADLDSAVGQGWIRAVDPTPPPARLIVTSRFRAFLERLRGHEQVAAVIHKPVTAEALLGALLSSRSDVATLSRGAADPLDDPARDAELERRGLRSTTPDPELVAVAELVARGVGTPASIVTIVDSAKQIFIGATGLPRDLSIAGGTLRSWSFCQHVARDNAPLIVEDAREHPVLSDNPLVAMNLVRSYAGFPVVLEGVGAVGSVCAVSGEPRQFDAGSIATLQLAARLVSEQLATRGYAAPEQMIPGAAHPQPVLDTYALAAVTYAMLTGRAPFEAASSYGVLALQQRGEIMPASSARPGLSPSVDALFSRALDPEPSRRFTSPVAFADALAAALLASPGERAQGPISAPQDGVPQSRGLAFRLCRAEVARRLGDRGEARVLGGLAPADREALAAATDDAALYPVAPFVAYLRALDGEASVSAEALGGALASAALTEMLRRLQVARTPEALLEVAGPLLRRFHAWGRVQFERTSTHSAKIELWLPEGLAPVMCRYVSGFLRALLATSGRTTRLLELRCGSGCAGACVLQVGWS